MTWSDLPVKGVFAPLIHRSVTYLSAARQMPEPAVVGKPLHMSVRLGEINSRTSFVLRSPSGLEERVSPTAYSTTGAATFETARTEEAGIYTLHALGEGESPPSRKLIHAVAVNLAREESDLRSVSNEEWTRFWQQVGIAPERVRRLHVDDPLEAAIHESRYGVELWTWFVMLALVCAGAEMFLGRENKNLTGTETEDHAGSHA